MIPDEEVVSLPLDELIELIEEPNRSACKQLLEHYSDVFLSTPGSRIKHQAWPGGLQDHIVEVMNRARLIHMLDIQTGRLSTLPVELRYNLSDLMLCCFAHDLDKLAKYASEKWPLETPCGPLETKSERKYAQQLLLQFYGFLLTPAHYVALQQAEGIRDADFSSRVQIMSPLGYAVNSADGYSAVWGNYPLAVNDPFKGAHRIAQT